MTGYLQATGFRHSLNLQHALSLFPQGFDFLQTLPTTLEAVVNSSPSTSPVRTFIPPPSRLPAPLQPLSAMELESQMMAGGSYHGISHQYAMSQYQSTTSNTNIQTREDSDRPAKRGKHASDGT